MCWCTAECDVINILVCNSPWTMKSSKRRLQALTEGSDGLPNYLKMEDSETSIPPVFRSRLHELFSQIEKEFDLLYTENLNRKSNWSIIIFIFIVIVFFWSYSISALIIYYILLTCNVMIMSNIGMYNVDICFHLFLCSSYTKILRLFSILLFERVFLSNLSYLKIVLGISIKN